MMKKLLAFYKKIFNSDRKTVQLPEEPQADAKKHSAISEEVEKRIIRHLSSFEKKHQFLSPNVSLSGMSKDFATNASYLSATIKKHKNSNFNNYINDLRIEYIILKFKTHPEYFNYKIAYLAQECGFASYAVFHRAFVQKTGISPSKFISNLKVQKRE